MQKYQVKIVDANGFTSYLSHRDRTSWGKRTAVKHAREFAFKSGVLRSVTIEEA